MLQINETFLIAGIPPFQIAVDIRISGTLSDLADSAAKSLETVTFTLYRDPEGLIPLWSETQNLEIDARGRYQALLGADTEGGIPLAHFSATDARWLGVRLSGYPEQPPVMLLSVPYALKAADAETLGGKPPSAYMTVEQAAPTPSENTTPVQESRSYNKVNVPIVGDGYKGYLAKFMNNNTIVTSRIFENSSGIGVNNSTPRSPFDVSGEIFADRLTLSDPGTSTLWTLDHDLDSSNPPKGRFRLLWRPDSATSYGILTVKEGAIALDHDNPRTALDINGQLAVNGAIKLARDLGTTTPIWGFDNVTSPSRFRLFYQPTINTFGWVLMSATENRIGMFTETPRTALDVWGEVTATNRLTLAQDTSGISKTPARCSASSISRTSAPRAPRSWWRRAPAGSESESMSQPACSMSPARSGSTERGTESSSRTARFRRPPPLPGRSIPSVSAIRPPRRPAAARQSSHKPKSPEGGRVRRARWQTPARRLRPMEELSPTVSAAFAVEFPAGRLQPVG